MRTEIDFNTECWELNAIVLENSVMDADEFAGFINLEEDPREKIIMKQMLFSALLANLYMSEIMIDVIEDF